MPGAGLRRNQALVSASDFDTSFPYLKTPRPGSPNGLGVAQNGIANPSTN